MSETNTTNNNLNQDGGAVVGAEAGVSAVSGEKSFSQAEMDAAVETALREEAERRAAEEAGAQLADEARKDREIADLKRQIQLDKAAGEVVAQLKKAGAQAPELLYAVKKGELEFDADGKLINLVGIIEDLKTEYAEQFGIAKPRESIDAGKGYESKSNALSPGQLDKMSPAEIIANMPAIDAYLASLK